MVEEVLDHHPDGKMLLLHPATVGLTGIILIVFGDYDVEKTAHFMLSLTWTLCQFCVVYLVFFKIKRTDVHSVYVHFLKRKRKRKTHFICVFREVRNILPS